MHSPRSGAFLRTATPSPLWRGSGYHRRSSLLRRSTRKGRVPSAEPLSFIPAAASCHMPHGQVCVADGGGSRFPFFACPTASRPVSGNCRLLPLWRGPGGEEVIRTQPRTIFYRRKLLCLDGKGKGVSLLPSSAPFAPSLHAPPLRLTNTDLCAAAGVSGLLLSHDS